MQITHDLLILDVQNEHNLEHNLAHSPLFKEPKIYDANGDLTKRWYVYFSYVDPSTGKMKRMKNIYGKANRYKTKESRYYILRLYRRRLLKLLQEGYNPYGDNTELHLKQSNENTNTQKLTKEETLPEPPHIPNSETDNQVEVVNEKSLREAMDFALDLKESEVSGRTMVDYKSRADIFVRWVEDKHGVGLKISKVDKMVLMEYLNHLQKTTSPRNRNNSRTCLSSLFQVLEDNDHIEKNFIKSIKPSKSSPKRNKSYTEKEHQAIFEYLETEDPILLLFIKFVSYNFLRPKEVCRLRVKDINLESKTLQFKAKNKLLKIKRIPSILLNELSVLSELDGELLLFTPTQIGGTWDANLESRREHFTNRFKKVVKQHFGLDSNYGLYSFRHTFITKLYRSMLKESTPFAAKSALMLITGHTSMTSLEAYLREIDAELAGDYSEGLLSGTKESATNPAANVTR